MALPILHTGFCPLLTDIVVGADRFGDDREGRWCTLFSSSCRAGQELKAAWTMMQIETKRARSENPYRWPSSAVGRFRLGGQVWLGIENIKLKETANAVKQSPLKSAILNRVGSD